MICDHRTYPDRFGFALKWLGAFPKEFLPKIVDIDAHEHKKTDDSIHDKRAMLSLQMMREIVMDGSYSSETLNMAMEVYKTERTYNENLDITPVNERPVYVKPAKKETCL